MSARKQVKLLSRSALVKQVARQTLWAVVSRTDGKIVDVQLTRHQARELAKVFASRHCTVMRLDVRVKGVRA